MALIKNLIFLVCLLYNQREFLSTLALRKASWISSTLWPLFQFTLNPANRCEYSLPCSSKRSHALLPRDLEISQGSHSGAVKTQQCQ